MTPGMNIRIRVWKVTNEPDDRIGGAVLSGTIIHDNVPARFEETKQEMLLLQQGYEVSQIFSCITHAVSPMYKEKDEVEVIFPENHPFYHEFLQVKGIQFTSLHPSDSRSVVMLTLKRKDYAHSTNVIL
jgi:hypothetical protein